MYKVESDFEHKVNEEPLQMVKVYLTEEEYEDLIKEQ